MNSVEEKKQIAANTNELMDHLVHLIENEDKRFSFEWGVGGEAIKMEVYDKEKNMDISLISNQLSMMKTVT